MWREEDSHKTGVITRIKVSLIIMVSVLDGIKKLYIYGSNDEKISVIMTRYGSTNYDFEDH